jgi:hypothetical protein
MGSPPGPSPPGPEMRLPAVSHRPTLLNRAMNRATCGCNFTMAHPRGEGISFEGILQTHAPTGATPSLFDRSAGRPRKDAISAEAVCTGLLAPVSPPVPAVPSDQVMRRGRARPQESERKGSQTERLCSLAVVGMQKQGNRMLEDFARPNCDSASIACSDVAEDDDRVVCPVCGMLLATRAEFRRFVEWRARCSRLHTSGR